MHRYLHLLFFLGAAFFLSITNALAQINPGDISINSVTLAGTGCPAGSVHADMAPDGSALTLLFDRFVGEISPVDRLVRVICDVRLRLKKPRAMSFAFASADIRGFVHLEDGARAVQRIRLAGGFDENGQREVNLSQQIWNGPLTEPFTISALQPEEGVSPIGCQGNRPQTMIRLRVAITLRSKKINGGSGQVAVDSFDGGMTQRYNLQWTPCPP